MHNTTILNTHSLKLKGIFLELKCNGQVKIDYSSYLVGVSSSVVVLYQSYQGIYLLSTYTRCGMLQ